MPPKKDKAGDFISPAVWIFIKKLIQSPSVDRIIVIYFVRLT